MENEIIYLKIPIRFQQIYEKLLLALADQGKTILDSCNKANDIQSNIIVCWNLFQTALACEELNRTKEADLFIDYIGKQLNIVYKNGNTEITPEVIVSINKYIHKQETARYIWEINHGLNTNDIIISIYDDIGNIVFGNVTIIDNNKLEVTFNSPMKGIAICI